MKLKTSSLVCLLLGCLVSGVTTATQQSTSLTEYLNLANTSGFNIIFSSALVRPHFQITYDDELPVTLEKIAMALHAYDLDLTGDSTRGYRVTRQRADENAPQPSDPGFPPLDEIVVNASLHEFKLQHIHSSLMLDRENLSGRPVIANDVFRIGSRLPGTATNGISSRAAIRGGLANETLIIFDGMRLYDPFHLHQFNDLFSAIDSRYVAGINFMTGGFSARYGDRMSGVMEIESIAPADMKPQQQLGIGLYTASYLNRGTFGDSDYLVSLRRSTIDLIGNLASSDLGTPAFSDLYARVDTSLGPQTDLSTRLLWFGDDVSINNSAKTEKADSAYGNTYLWFTLKREPDDFRESSTQLGFTAIKNDRAGQVTRPGMVSGNLRDDREFRIYHLGHVETLKLGGSILEVGASYRYLDSEYGYQHQLDINPSFANLSNVRRPDELLAKEDYNGNQAALYATVKHAFNPSLYLELGIRFDIQDYLDESWSEETAPRFSILYLPPFGGELRFSSGEFYQAPGIHELDFSDGIDAFQKAEESQHQVLSYRRRFNHFELGMEAYHKEAGHPWQYFENLTDPVSLLPELQVDRTSVIPDEVTAWGLELTLNTWFGQNELWFNYTRAEVEERVNGRRVRRSTDQKHAANLGWSRKFVNWQATVESTYHSGWPTSVITMNDSGSASPVIRNGRRLDHFLTVDIKATRSWQLANSSLRLDAGVTNLFNRENQVGTNYLMDSNSLVSRDRFSLPIAPFLDVFWTF